MIISFSIENWKSFRDPASFTMVAGKERQHGERVAKVKKYSTRLLPVSLIYGGNASGKTNLFSALSFSKMLVVKGTHPDGLIPLEPFRLATKGEEMPSRFTFELLIDEVVYEYSFAVDRRQVLEERLVQVNSSSEKLLFDRKGEEVEFGAGLKKDQLLQFAFRGTRENQLFLTNSVSQKVDNFRPVYDWFRDTLELVAPDARFESFEQFLDEGNPLFGTMNDLLPQLDTGINRLGGEVVPLESLPIPDPMKSSLLEDVKEGMSLRLLGGPVNERFIVTHKNGELVAKKLVTYHPTEDGGEAKFEMRMESDGSQRVIDLLPAFLDLSSSNSKKVYVIDEVDRSLHTLLTRQLLTAYLSSCSSQSRSQLLLTTHDVLLMDQQLLRRDEMWVTERNSAGASELISFSEFKDVRYDKDIRKSYLQGRMGGVPRILLEGTLDTGSHTGCAEVH
jgi:uncharacterized protein